MIDRGLAVFAALNMLVAVGAGAFGAHGLRRILSPEMLAVWQTGVTYQIAHALGILFIALAAARMPTANLHLAGWFMGAGIVLFSGSLYLLATTGPRWLGMVTPLGGLAFIIGWAMVAWMIWRAPQV